VSERNEFLKKLSGPHFEAILRGGEPAFRLLSDPDKGVRGAALLQLGNNCPSELRAQFAEICQDIAENDSDEANQVMAIDILGRHYQDTRNRAISSFLARTTLIEDIGVLVRCFAYLALRQVQEGDNAVDRMKRLNLLEKQFSKAQSCNSFGETSSQTANNYIINEIDFDFVRRLLT
jgi:hypothetical protein